MNKLCLKSLFILFAVLIASQSMAQQSKIFGAYELHYSVVNTTFLEPEVASTYAITRGKNRAILNLAVRELDSGDKPGGPMILKGRTWDLIQNQFLEFQEISEGPATYYIADFKFINEEWRFFEVDFRPEGSNETFTLKFKHQLYIN